MRLLEAPVAAEGRNGSRGSERAGHPVLLAPGGATSRPPRKARRRPRKPGAPRHLARVCRVPDSCRGGARSSGSAELQPSTPTQSAACTASQGWTEAAVGSVSLARSATMPASPIAKPAAGPPACWSAGLPACWSARLPCRARLPGTTREIRLPMSMRDAISRESGCGVLICKIRIRESACHESNFVRGRPGARPRTSAGAVAAWRRTWRSRASAPGCPKREAAC